MGVSAHVGFDFFPPQGSFVGKRVRVCFNYDASRFIGGEVVRDDAAGDGRRIIRLDDGRHVLDTECQFSVEADAPAERHRHVSFDFPAPAMPP